MYDVMIRHKKEAHIKAARTWVIVKIKGNFIYFVYIFCPCPRLLGIYWENIMWSNQSSRSFIKNSFFIHQFILYSWIQFYRLDSKLWNTSTTSDSHMLERVQLKFLHFLSQVFSKLTGLLMITYVTCKWGLFFFLSFWILNY